MTHAEQRSVSSTVEPALLSLFCRGVNEHRKREGKADLRRSALEGGRARSSRISTGSASPTSRSACGGSSKALITEHGFGTATRSTTRSPEGGDGRGARDAHQPASAATRASSGTDRVELTRPLTRAVVDERDLRRREETVGAAPPAVEARRGCRSLRHRLCRGGDRDVAGPEQAEAERDRIAIQELADRDVDDDADPELGPPRARRDSSGPTPPTPVVCVTRSRPIYLAVGVPRPERPGRARAPSRKSRRQSSGGAGVPARSRCGT